MTTREEWIYTLREQPRDLIVLGAFADWCEENDREEHRYLRLVMQFLEEVRHTPGRRFTDQRWQYTFRFGGLTHIVRWHERNNDAHNGYFSGPNKRRISMAEPYPEWYREYQRRSLFETVFAPEPGLMSLAMKLHWNDA